MKKSWIKYIVLIVVAGLLAYNSVYFKKLDAKATTTETNLNPPEFAQKFWTKEFTPYLDSAVEINDFAKMLKEDPNRTFQKYSKSQGIGNNSFFLVKGEGLIKTVNEDNIIVTARSGSADTDVQLSTGIYFGNAVRDVTGQISMGDFKNTMDFNSVSIELNKIVRTDVVLPFKSKAVKDDVVKFVGCIEINKELPKLNNIDVLPLRVQINNK